MLLTIEIKCSHCHNPNPEWEKNKGKQHYLGKKCGRQFISDHERTSKGTLSWVKNMIKIMLVRGVGIRDIGVILGISITTVLKVLKSTKYRIKPKQTQYDGHEIDEFWTYGGKKENNVWFIYHRETGEIVAFVWGKRGLKTA